MDEIGNRCTEWRHFLQDRKVTGDPKQAQADDQQASDRATTECDVQGLRQAGTSRFSRAHIRSYRNHHTDVAGSGRANRADGKADGGLRPQVRDKEHDCKQQHSNNTDSRVLPVQVGGSA